MLSQAQNLRSDEGVIRQWSRIYVPYTTTGVGACSTAAFVDLIIIDEGPVVDPNGQSNSNLANRGAKGLKTLLTISH